MTDGDARAQPRARRLWSRAFATYWSATSVSNLGSGVTLVALPVLAVQQLGAGAAQLGILRALEAAPYVLLALAVGRLVDRSRPLALMILADAARACLLTATFALAATSLLGFPALYILVFAVGTFTVVYDVAQFTVMPAIVKRSQLVEANAAVELARGAAFTLGPGLGGLLIAVLRAGPALLADAVSYVFSAASLSTLHGRTTQPSAHARSQEHGRITDGVRFVLSHPELRAMTTYLGLNNVCNQAFLTGLIAFLEVDQRRPSSQVGLAFGGYGAGFLLAALSAPALGRRWGTGPSVTASSLISASGAVAVAVSALAQSHVWSALAVTVFGAFLVGFAAPIFNVPSVALRLAVTPADRLGRVNAVVKMVSQGALPLGALVAGALFDAFAPATAFGAIAAASFAATAVLVFGVRPREDLSSRPSASRSNPRTGG